MLERKEKKSYEEKLAAIRNQLVTELEDLYTQPEYGSSDEEMQSIDKIRDGIKVRVTSRSLIDKVARIANENGIHTIEELHRAYDDLLLDWRRMSELSGL